MAPKMKQNRSQEIYVAINMCIYATAVKSLLSSTQALSNKIKASISSTVTL